MGTVESEPGSSGRVRVLLMLSLQNLRFNVQHSGCNPASYMSVLSWFTVSSIWAHLERILKKSGRWGYPEVGSIPREDKNLSHTGLDNMASLAFLRLNC